jgi:hypothetical protein
MECFIIKEGVERKAELEDIFPLIDENSQFKYMIHQLNQSCDLGVALAYLSDEMKNIIYRNMSARISGKLKKDVSVTESSVYEKNKYFVQGERAKLIDFFGENNRILSSNCQEQIVWRDTVPAEESPNTEEPLNDVEKMIKQIERACDYGSLDMSYGTIKMTGEDIQKAFASFHNRRDELRKIRSLRTFPQNLPAAELLFEEGTIEDLMIDDFTAYPFPSFLEKYHALKSINIQCLLTEFPSWIRSAVSLRRLRIILKDVAFIPDWIEELQSLTDLSLGLIHCNIKTLPDSLCNLKNLAKFELFHSDIEKFDNIGNLQSLTELLLRNNCNLKNLPDSIGNLKNLTKLEIPKFSFNDNKNLKNIPDSIGKLKNLVKLELDGTSIEKLPDSIGDLQSLSELLLRNNKNMKNIPDSIGNLKNLTRLELIESSIEKLPDAIVNCTALEYINIRGTNITSFPYFISSSRKINQSIQLIPRGQSVSYRAFCNHYYKIVETVIWLREKVWRKNPPMLEDYIELLSDDFFYCGMKLVFDCSDDALIRHTLTPIMEREQDFYRKKLMEIAIESILSVQQERSIPYIALLLASLVDIKNNPLDAACAKYLSANWDAFSNIDFKSAILPEEEREEINFIKRAMSLSEIAREEGVLVIEKHLDHDGIAKRDIFEYGLPFVIDQLDIEVIDTILTRLIAHETNPVRKNFALAKKEAVLSLYNGDDARVMALRLCAYFDKSIEKVILEESAQAENPRIGFFWWKHDDITGKFLLPIIEKYELDDFERMMATGHSEIWKRELKKGYVTGNYKDIPRGRVFWDTESGCSIVYTGEHDVPQGLKDVLAIEFVLDLSKTVFHYNQHYDMKNMAEDMFSGEVDELDKDMEE